ncbi:MAG: PaaI family thioesterase [Pseudomonadota bacterium]
MNEFAKVRDLSGLEFLKTMIEQGIRPPMAHTLGFRLVEVDDGYAMFEGEVKKDYYNPLGVGHGGYAATLLDSALGCAIQTRLPKNTPYGTVELKINYIRPVLVDCGIVRATANAIHVGRRMGTSEGRLVDERGKLLAHGSTTCMIYSDP